MNSKKTVVVGMSGGVDSSVSALLLKEQGFEVIGLFMQNWQSEPGEVCTSEIDYKDAELVCDQLGIKLFRANFSKDYWDKVFEEFLSEHKRGRTPNPDVLCNREIKFKSFRDYAIRIGADYIATGHYAALENKNSKVYLKRAKDLNKDQTYFLHEVKSKDFENTIFPLADLTKPEVRKIADKHDLSNKDKKDSVGICFIGERNMQDFLSRFITLSEGDILDEKGVIIGNHQGATLYTEGQRKGLHIGGVKNAKEEPWYVFNKDIERNLIYVCQGAENPLLFSKALKLDSLHCITDKVEDSIKCEVQIRHRQTPVQCQLNPQTLEVVFDEPVSSVSPGQYAVFYSDNYCLGGGIIEKNISMSL